MSQLVRLEGKDTTQSAHCAVVTLLPNFEKWIFDLLFKQNLIDVR